MSKDPNQRPVAQVAPASPNLAFDGQLQSLILGEIPAIIAVKDAVTRQFLFTRGGEFVGLHADQRLNLGKTAEDFFEPALANAVKRAEDDLLASGVELQERIFSTEIDGEERSFLSKRKIIADANGEARYLLLINVDVSHEVKIRKELERNRLFLDHVIRNLPCIVSVTDIETGEPVLANLTHHMPDDTNRAEHEIDDRSQNMHDLRSLPPRFVELLTTPPAMSEGADYAQSHYKGGTDFGHYDVKKRLLDDPLDETAFVLAVAEDVTERRKMECDLRRSEANLQRSQKVAKLGSWLFDLETGELEWSQTLYNLWGTSPERFTPSPGAILDGIADDDRDKYLQMVEQVRKTGQNGTTSGRIRRFDNIMLHVRVDIEPECNAQGDVIRLFGIVQDISEQVRAQARMRYLAHHDGLTALPNRALFEERLDRAKIHAKRHGTAFAVLCIDINDFKGINDSLGHGVGDRLLCEVAKRLSGLLRETDTVARLGADEFAIIQESIETEEDAARLATRILTSLGQSFELDQHDVFSSCTVGISFLRNSRFGGLDPLQEATIALAEAKKESRGTFRFFSAEINAELQRRQRIDQRIRHALKDGLFELAFQPQLCLASNRIVGAEALMRWHDPILGTVPPTQFIPIAEDRGLILDIGELALREACLTARKWLDQGLGELRMAVNLSPAQFAFQDLLELVASTLADTKLPAHLLELEITEGTLMRDGIGAVETIRQLHQLGVSLSIDDFGSGYSSLSYLKRFNVGKIKVDRAFVKDLPDDQDDVTITKTILNLGRSLGMKVLAEGVETEAQLAFLRENGCDEIQGYHIAKPLPNDQFTDFVLAGFYSVAPPGECGQAMQSPNDKNEQIDAAAGARSPGGSPVSSHGAGGAALEQPNIARAG